MTEAPSFGVASARACANIALIKYWGKRDATLNLPAAGSLSITLEALQTTTEVDFTSRRDGDELWLNDAPATGAELSQCTAFLDLAVGGARPAARVTSRNNFATASGLASSASGFAALALAATAAAGLQRTPRQLSCLARRGSGSAARSLFGGLVEMHAGVAADGDDAYAEPLGATHEPLRMAAERLAAELHVVIVEIGGGVRKAHGSRDAMEHSRQTSPYYDAWLATVNRDLQSARAAIASHDVAALGALLEANALAMHACALAARPAISYFRPATLAVLQAVREHREAGGAAWATMDAGPHVKIVTASAEQAADVARRVSAISDVTAVTHSRAGGPAVLL